MGDTASYSLYSLGAGTHFPEGTLFELADGAECVLPDRGDGLPAAIDRSKLSPCPPFAENVPPGQCPVAVTSLDRSLGDIGGVTVEQTPHGQAIIIPLNADTAAISEVSVTDRLRAFETELYLSPSTDLLDGHKVYRLPIGWFRPGFYAAELRFEDDTAATITFIKFFPERFSRMCSELPETAGSDIPETPIPAQADEPRSGSDIFSDKLLNTALELTTEWGENFYKPIHERIRRTYPTLTDDEIDELTRLSREAESYIYRLAEQELAGSITEGQIMPEARRKFGWLSLDNASRLKNIGMFYARK